MAGKKRAAATQKWISALAAGEVEGAKARREAAEQTYTNVLNRIGAPGTYEQTGGTQSGLGLQQGQPSESIFKTEKAKSFAARSIDPRYTHKSAISDITTLDPEKATQAAMGSTQGRIVSRLTAEAEQLLAREGPLYDEMLKNVQLPILEGAGQMARENAEALKRQFARGGSARRQAFQTVQQIRTQERINSQKVRNVAQARFRMDKWARSNAQDVVRFGQEWASNLGGIRETYQSAMDNITGLMLNNALPLMAAAQDKANQYRMAAHAEKRNKLGRWVNGILGATSLITGAGGISGIATSGVQSFLGNSLYSRIFGGDKEKQEEQGGGGVLAGGSGYYSGTIFGGR